MIHSRLHKMLEDIKEEFPDSKFMSDFSKSCLNSPRFFVSPDAANMMCKGDLRSIVEAMIEAGRFRLPFPEMVLETDIYNVYKNNSTSPGTCAALIKEAGDKFYKCTVSISFSDRYFVFPMEFDLFWQEEFSPTELLASGSPYKSGFKMQGNWPEGDEHGVPEYLFETIRNSQNNGFNMPEFIGAVATQLVSFAVMLLDVKGFEKDYVAPKKLNKQREKRGKTPIPAYNYVHLSRVYLSDGTSISASEAKKKHMPMHMRSGHIRRQRHGPEFSLEKIIYIEPVIVNFDPGEKLVHKDKRVVV